jgi:anthranilate phosphoribosyltransferase
MDPADRARWVDANVAWGLAALDGREEQGVGALLCTTALLLLAARAAQDYERAIGVARELLA